jgi:hypothetical protein
MTSPNDNAVFMGPPSGDDDAQDGDGGNNLFCISFYMDTEDGFVTRVEMPEKLSEEELQLSSLLLNSIFSGKLETDAIKAITKLYAESPAIYRDCIQIITGWQDLKKNEDKNPLIKPTETLRK